MGPQGCIQECLGCEATNEFKLYPSKDVAKDDSQQMMYSLEESTFCCRFCCMNNREFTQTVWLGNKDTKSDVVLKMARPFAFAPPGQNCCCFVPLNCKPCMQTLSMTKADDSPLADIEIPCAICVPALKIKDPAGTIQYSLSQPTCLGGMCINPFA